MKRIIILTILLLMAISDLYSQNSIDPPVLPNIILLLSYNIFYKKYIIRKKPELGFFYYVKH